MFRGKKHPIIIPIGLVLSLGLSTTMSVAADSDLGKSIQAVPISTAQAARGSLPVYLEGIGAVQAFNKVDVHPQVNGQLISVKFKEGQEVHEGDILGQIDPRLYQAAVDQAIANRDKDQALLANAKLDLERYGSLAEKKYISQQQVDQTRALVLQLEAAVKGDEASIDSARVQLGYTVIRSPIDGLAGIRQIDAGNILHSDSPPGTVSTSDTLVLITQINPVAVVFTLNQDELPNILRAEKKGRIAVDVYSKEGGKILDHGSVEAIDNQVDVTTSMIKFKAVFPNTHKTLWPGLFVNVRLLLDTKSNIVTVPTTAIQRGVDGESVFVVNADQTVQSKFVVTGTSFADTTEILEGLNQGEVVVTAGQFRLKPGTKIIASAASSLDGSK